jgi:hypothetical protein
MNAHAFPSAVPAAFSPHPAPQSAATPRALDAPTKRPLDLAGRSVKLPAGRIGTVTAWYFGIAPGRDISVVALRARAWRDGQPATHVQTEVAALIERGVSVLLIDLRRSEHLWSAWTGCTRERIVRAALDYVEDRGYDTDAVKVTHAC